LQRYRIHRLLPLLVLFGLTTAPATANPQLPVINLLPQSTFATGGDTGVGSNNIAIVDGDVRVPFTVGDQISPRLSFLWAHGNIDQTIGRVSTATGAWAEPGSIHDITDDFSLGYQVGTPLSLHAGYYSRHEPGYDENAYAAYLEGDTSFGPSFNGAKLFTYSLRGSQTLAHHTDASELASLPSTGASHDEGNLLTYSTTLGAHYKLNRTPYGLSVFAYASILNDYFDGTPFAWYYTATDYGANKVVTRDLSYEVDICNLTQYKQGYPFVYPNALHRAKIVLSADIRVGR
jgi:hypothetical protein